MNLPRSRSRRVRSLWVAGVAICLSTVFSMRASAQNRGPGGPGGPPPGQRGPGAPGAPGGPAGPGSPGGPPPRGANNGNPNSQASGGSAMSGGARPNALQFGPVGRWWDDKSVVQSVGITRPQQKKMDSIFDANKPAILSSYRSLEAEQAKLTALSKQPQVDQAQLFAQIDSVSKARAELQKATTQMLLEIRQQMDRDQIGRLEKVQ